MVLNAGNFGSVFWGDYMDWQDWMRDLLCRLFKEIGGNCSNLGTTPTNWVATVDAAYQGKTPTFATAEAQKGFLYLLSELECGLDDSRGTLSSTDDGKMRALITRLRGVIPQP